MEEEEGREGVACMAEAGGKPFLPGQYKVMVQITACTPGRIKSRSARRAKRSSRAKYPISPCCPSATQALY